VLVAIERGASPAAAKLPRDEPVFLSAITASELLHGVHRARTAAQRARRERYVESVLAAVPVLPADLAVARAHARIWAELAARGEVIGGHDLWIAATALAHDLTVLTANRRDFARVEGLELAVWP
jgi:tRNA(fMet)-specific endonuclease VapC